MNPLEQLPVKKIWARKTGGEMVPVLVDGDYDGEYFDEFKWRISPKGYVYTNPTGYEYDDKTGGWKALKRSANGYANMIYLHQFVLPYKKGFWITHLNGDKLDNRSANLAHMTPKEIMKLRDQRTWITHVRKYYEKMASLRGGSDG